MQETSKTRTVFKFYWYWGLGYFIRKIRVHGGLSYPSEIGLSKDIFSDWWLSYIFGGISQVGIDKSKGVVILISALSAFLALFQIMLEVRGSIPIQSWILINVAIALFVIWVSGITLFRNQYLALRSLSPELYASATLSRSDNIIIKALCYESLSLNNHFLKDTSNGHTYSYRLRTEIEEFLIESKKNNANPEILVQIKKIALEQKPYFEEIISKLSRYQRGVERVLAQKELASWQLNINPEILCDPILGFNPRVFFEGSLADYIRNCQDYLRIMNLLINENKEVSIDDIAKSYDEIKLICLNLEYIHRDLNNRKASLIQLFIADEEHSYALQLMSANSRTHALRIFSRYLSDFALSALELIATADKYTEKDNFKKQEEVRKIIISRLILILNLTNSYKGTSIISGLNSISLNKLGGKNQEILNELVRNIDKNEINEYGQKYEAVRAKFIDSFPFTHSLVNGYLEANLNSISRHLENFLFYLFENKERNFIISVGKCELVRDLIANLGRQKNKSDVEDPTFKATYVPWSFNSKSESDAKIQRYQVRREYNNKERDNDLIPMIYNKNLYPAFDQKDTVVFILEIEAFIPMFNKEGESSFEIITHGYSKERILEEKKLLQEKDISAYVIFVGGDYKELENTFTINRFPTERLRSIEKWFPDEYDYMFTESKNPNYAPQSLIKSNGDNN